jgi:hypothetical protein
VDPSEEDRAVTDEQRELLDRLRRWIAAADTGDSIRLGKMEIVDLVNLTTALEEALKRLASSSIPVSAYLPRVTDH